jgi:hypothetical protein
MQKTCTGKGHEWLLAFPLHVLPSGPFVHEANGCARPLCGERH